jgi:Family of unknown function (DUF5681)
VSNLDDSYAVGYQKPPRHSQFAKGQSGNPRGRPKGSQNVSAVLQRAARQRVRVTSNGVSRFVTKLEAAVTQLLNQAASGDPRAIRELLYLHRLCEEPAEAVRAETGPQELDKLVMESIRKRILQSEELSSAKATDPKVPKSSEEVH